MAKILTQKINSFQTMYYPTPYYVIIITKSLTVIFVRLVNLGLWCVCGGGGEGGFIAVVQSYFSTVC